MKNIIFVILGGTIALFGLGYVVYDVLELDSHQGLSEEVFNKLE